MAGFEQVPPDRLTHMAKPISPLPYGDPFLFSPQAGHAGPRCNVAAEAVVAYQALRSRREDRQDAISAAGHQPPYRLPRLPQVRTMVP